MNKPEATQIITCPCSVCGGKSAKVRGDAKYSATAIHNLVGLAHSPLNRAASAVKFGPWKV